MATGVDLIASLANLDLQDSGKLTLNVVTANVNRVQGDKPTQTKILQYFVHEHQPDVFMMQGNPWCFAFGKYAPTVDGPYNCATNTRRGSPKISVYCRYTSFPKVYMKNVVELKLAMGSLADQLVAGSGLAQIIVQRAIAVAFTVTRNMASHTTDPHLIIISWHGEHGCSDEQKEETFEVLLKLVNHLHAQCYPGRHIPIVLGGDFNLKCEKAQEIMGRSKKSKLQLVTCPVPLSRLGKPQTDFFIVTKDVQVNNVHAIPYEIDPDGQIIDHVPVMTTLTFPKIRTRDDILVNNLEKMLSPQEPLTPCTCENTQECPRGRIDVIHLLPCRHTVHLRCLAANRFCPICASGESSNPAPTIHLPPVAQPSSALPHVIVHPITSMLGLVTCWNLFPSHCQSAIAQKVDTNCEVAVSLILCRFFFDSCEIPDARQQLSQSWIYRVIRAILIGSKIYDRLHATPPLAITAVIQILGDALAAELRSFEGGCDQKSVDWEKLSEMILIEAIEQPQTALLCILEEKVVAFVHFKGRVVLLDTHSHGNTGALVAISSRSNVSQLVSWFKGFDQKNDEMMEVRRVRYSPEGPAVAAAKLFSYQPPL